MDRTVVGRIIKNAVVFSELRKQPVIKCLAELMTLPLQDKEGAYALCCDIARELYPDNLCLTDKVFELISVDDNLYIRNAAKGDKLPNIVTEQANVELEALAQAAACSSEYISRLFGLPSPVPRWEAEKRNFAAEYAAHCEHARVTGWGEFARFGVFTLTESGELVPVRNPDPQRLSGLFGYERERNLVLRNTRAFLDGKPVSNMLLYGDAGTGKSSTVKAVANELRDRGLRLIQVQKSNLHHIPTLLDSLSDNPLKFIIFIDDLSFESNDRDFTSLKTILEGSVTAKAPNTVIYATSNRRHLIRESMEARRGDEVHLRDTLEESASLAARFGLVVTFTRPDRDEYRELVLGLAKDYGLKYPQEEALITEAEAWAIRAGGRTPRAAKQFVEFKMSE